MSQTANTHARIDIQVPDYMWEDDAEGVCRPPRVPETWVGHEKANLRMNEMRYGNFGWGTAIPEDFAHGATRATREEVITVARQAMAAGYSMRVEIDGEDCSYQVNGATGARNETGEKRMTRFLNAHA